MTPVETDRRRLDVAIVFVVLATLLLVFRAPWTESLWLDETLSAWTVRDSLANAWNRSLFFQTQSPLYYLVLWSVVREYGDSELTLRGVSIISALVSLFAVFCIARCLTGRSLVAVLAVGFLLSCDVFQVSALTARPYALAMAFSLWSIVFLIDLVREWRPRTAILFTASLILTFYSHYLFSVVVVAHACVLFRHRDLLRRLAVWLVGATVVSIPGLYHLRSLQERSQGLVFTSTPHLGGIAVDSMPVPLVVSVFVGVALGLIWGARFRFAESGWRAIRVLTPYIVVAPIIFLAASEVTGAAVWLPRYWAWQTGVFSVLAAILMCSLVGERGARVAVCVTALFVLARMGFQRWAVEGWGPAAEVARSYQGRVVLFTGLIEAETQACAGKPGFEEYTRAPLITYGRSTDLSVARLSSSDEELLELFQSPVLLVAARKDAGSRHAPERFLEIARRVGRSVVEVPNGSGRIAVYRLE